MIIKLNPGDRINLTVSATETVQGNYGPQIKFSGSTPTDPDATLFLNVDTAESQLGRIGFTAQSVIGQTVEIAKVEKNGRKFTDINKPSGVVAAPRAATPAAPVKAAHSAGPYIEGLDDAPATVNRLDSLFTLYRTCFDEAASVAKGVPAGVQVTHEGIAAQAATLFIQASQRGIAA